MKTLEIISCDKVDWEDLNCFLKRFYGKTKGKFLTEHGDWWYKSHRNSLAIVKGSDIACYCALIPTCVSIRGIRKAALWWVDLVVAHRYRGMGLQSDIDRYLRESKELVLGFPNELAAMIHRKHGWGVREDGLVLMLPLIPDQIKSF